MRSFIADAAAPADLNVRVVLTDERGEIRGRFQQVLNKPAITQEHVLPPPWTSQYNRGFPRF